MSLRQRIVLLWHRLRGHTVRDLGHPRGHHRAWCYECRADLIEWPPNDWEPRWNVMDPNDPESPVIVPREDFHRLRSGKPSR